MTYAASVSLVSMVAIQFSGFDLFTEIINTWIVSVFLGFLWPFSTHLFLSNHVPMCEIALGLYFFFQGLMGFC